MRVLVTGATSMLGAGVIRNLTNRGDEVTAFQRNPSAVASQLGCKEILGSVANAAAVRSAVEGNDAVIHLAAKVAPIGSRADFEAVNVAGTGNVLDAMRAVGVDRWVYISTPSVAHAGKSLVGAGAAPAEPERTRGHYARSKALAETMVLAASDLSVVALRPHLVWGPGDTQLVGRIIERSTQGRLALVGTGAALIDTTYVDNAVDAIVSALDRVEQPEVRGQAFVVSNGEPRPVAEIIERICRAGNVKPPSRSVPLAVARTGGAIVEKLWEWTRRQGEPPMTAFAAEQLATAHWFDQRQTRRALSWEPQVSLAEGFERLRESLI